MYSTTNSYLKVKWPLTKSWDLLMMTCGCSKGDIFIRLSCLLHFYNFSNIQTISLLYTMIKVNILVTLPTRVWKYILVLKTTYKNNHKVQIDNVICTFFSSHQKCNCIVFIHILCVFFKSTKCMLFCKSQCWMWQ